MTNFTRSPLVHIIILNWNGKNDTLACLQSLQQLSYSNYHIIVVDNGSSDDSVAVIRTSYPDITLIETGANLGFSGGNNVGIQHALELNTDYIFLLNNDTEVDPEIVTAFISSAQQHPDAGALGARIYYHSEPEKIWCAGTKWSSNEGRFIQIGDGEIDSDGRFDKESISDYACGCAMFISAERFREIGLLNEDFFLYFEETDWCYRAKKLGYPSYYVPNAKLWHKVSSSFGGENSPLATYFITRNRLLWAKKHLPFAQRLQLNWTVLRRIISLFTSPLTKIQFDLLLKPKKCWWLVRQSFLAPMNHPYFLGAKDFWLQRFGNCPDKVRLLSKK